MSLASPGSTAPNLNVSVWAAAEPAVGALSRFLTVTPGVMSFGYSKLITPGVMSFEYPKLITPGVTVKNLDKAPTAGSAAAQTDTFRFGAVEPGDAKDIDWRVTPVKAGTYTVHYEVAAGLEGKAKAVTKDGSPVKGEFVVTISSKPPQTCVNDAGQVSSNCGP